MLEHLENRRLFAVTAEINAWTLEVNGDNSNNWISVEKSGDLIRVMVYVGGDEVEVLHAADSNVDDIVVYGEGGTDLITVANAISDDCTLWGGDGNDYLKGGGGYNVLFGHGVVIED